MDCASIKSGAITRSVQQCLICQRSTESTGDTGLLSLSPSFLERDLHVLFILRHVLELPSEQLENYLRLAPSCPLKEWVAICPTCNINYLDKCKRIFMELMAVKGRFLAARKELIEAIKKSAKGDGATTLLGRRRGRPKKKQIILNIQKETRTFVSQNEYMTSVDPFIAGDLMAKEKLAETQLIRDRIDATDSTPSSDDKVNLSEGQQRYLNECDGEVKLEPIFDTGDPATHSKAAHYHDPFFDGDGMPLDDNEYADVKRELILTACEVDCDDSGEDTRFDDDFKDDDWDAGGALSDSATDEDGSEVDEEKKNKSRKPLKANVRKRGRPMKTAAEPLPTGKVTSDPISRDHKKGQKQIQCEHCDNSFTLKSLYLNHLGSAHGLNEQLFTCSFEGCEKSFHKRSLLRDHEDMHKDPQHECKICGIAFQRRRALYHHRLQHKRKDSKPFHCSLCPARYSRRDNLKAHVRNIHNGNEGEGGDVTKTGVKKRSKGWHKRIHHKCDKCGLTFGIRKRLLGHLAKMHGESLSVTENAPCEDEGKPTKEVKKRNIVIKCDQDECSEIFNTERKLRLHQIRVHKINFYTCDECGWETANGNNLADHKKRYHGDKNDLQELTCPTCGKVMGSMQRLRAHIAQLHGNSADKFQCEHCGKDYTDKIGYLNHLGSVHGIKDQLRFACNFEGCERAFFKKSQLMYHQVTHKEPEYQCHVCGAALKKKQDFKRHVKRHEERHSKPFGCDYCPDTFEKKGYLEGHLRKIHKMGG